ncbi:MAG: tol-pal system protein YbgF [Proteobacteria bacterium]|nr:tol-pal system protein YbgF [Pseudomonadota bacterium]
MKKINRFFLLVFISLGLLSFSGCATQNDLEALQRDTNNNTKELLALQRNLYDLNSEIKNLSTKTKTDTVGKKINDLHQKMTILGAETKTKIGFLEKEMETANQPMRRYQADLGARLDKIQMEVQNLMGRFEESKYFAQKTFGETKTLKEAYQGKIDEMDKRIAALNKSVEEWEKKIAILEKEGKTAKVEGEPGEEKTSAIQTPPAQGWPTTEQVPSQKAEQEGKKVIASPDEAYKKAYEQFTKGNVEGAKADFKRFLEVYPKSKYAENAHYWLGECYFAEKKYEEAILEFDEVIKKYPKGNKTPDALFRQGIAFLEMKDAINAKLILKEVIKRFPKSDQAKRARKKMQEIG